MRGRNEKRRESALALNHEINQELNKSARQNLESDI